MKPAARLKIALEVPKNERTSLRPSEAEHHLMSTHTQTRTFTVDTAEAVTDQVVPADDRSGDGYDWVDTLEAPPGRSCRTHGSGPQALRRLDGLEALGCPGHQPAGTPAGHANIR
jgi:hypothetical protein